MNPNPQVRAGAARRRSISPLGALGALLLAATTSAVARADAHCTGNVLEHLVYKEGLLMIRSSWRNDWTVLCGIQTPWKGVSTESCFTWFGLVTSARTHNKPMIIYYDNSNSCAALATYADAPAPAYVRMAE